MHSLEGKKEKLKVQTPHCASADAGAGGGGKKLLALHLIPLKCEEKGVIFFFFFLIK